MKTKCKNNFMVELVFSVVLLTIIPEKKFTVKNRLTRSSDHKFVPMSNFI